MKTSQTFSEILSSLKSGGYIAFGFNYNGGNPNEIMVSNITQVYEDRVLVNFLYGHHSLAEYVKKEDIIAVGDMSASGKIKGWSGNFLILQPNHELILNNN